MKLIIINSIKFTFSPKSKTGLLFALVWLCCLFYTPVVWAQKDVVSPTDEAVYQKVPRRSLRKKEEKNREINKSDKQYSKVSRSRLRQKRDKSKEQTEYNKPASRVSRSWLRREENKSQEINSSNKVVSKVSRRSLRRKEHKNEEINDGGKVESSVSKKWLRRKEIKNKEINSGDKIESSVSRKWLRRKETKNKEINSGDKIEYNVSRNSLRKKEEKSHDINEYKAGYTETRAERRERLKRFFIPGDYMPKTPQEKEQLARDNAKKAYEYRGDIVLRKKSKDMHPSAEYLNGRAKNSYEKKERHRKRMLRRSGSNKKENMPKHLRKKEGKPRYDDVEKGLWND